MYNKAMTVTVHDLRIYTCKIRRQDTSFKESCQSPNNNQQANNSCQDMGLSSNGGSPSHHWFPKKKIMIQFWMISGYFHLRKHPNLSSFCGCTGSPAAGTASANMFTASVAPGELDGRDLPSRCWMSTRATSDIARISRMSWKLRSSRPPDGW